MIDSENVGYFDKVLEYLVNVDGTQASHSKITEICDGNKDLAIIIARQFRDRSFAIEQLGKLYGNDIVLNDVFSASMLLKRGGFTAELQKQIAKEEEENELKQLEKKSKELQIENMEFSKTIREQEQKIRDLDISLKTAEVFKTYWWAFTVGGALVTQLLNMFI